MFFYLHSLGNIILLLLLVDINARLHMGCIQFLISGVCCCYDSSKFQPWKMRY